MQVYQFTHSFFKLTSIILIYTIFQVQYITIEEANSVVGSLKSMYTGLTISGIYLPKYNSPCITSQYLLQVALKKVFSCKSAEVRVAYLLRKATKLDLYREIFQIVGQEEDLGFTSNKLPDREWLINVLNYISPNHRYFKPLSSNQLNGITQQDLKKLRDLNTTLYRTKRLRFFKTTQEQRLQKKVHNINHQIEKTKTIIEEDKKRQTNMQGKLLSLKKQLVEILPQVQDQSNQNQANSAFSQNFNLQEEVFSE